MGGIVMLHIAVHTPSFLRRKITHYTKFNFNSPQEWIILDSNFSEIM